MDPYQGDEEQIEQLKKWWQENGKSLVAIVTITIAGIVGFNLWKNHKAETLDAASLKYQEIVKAVNTPGGDGELKVKNILHLTDTMKTEFGGSTYSQYAALLAAKVAVDGGDLGSAQEQLKWIVSQESEPTTHELAILRLAKVQFAQDKADDALKLLDSITPEVYQSGFAELKGDIYLAQDDKAQARQYYTKAIELQQKPGKQVNRLLQMKADNLAEVPAALLIPSQSDSAQGEQEG